MVPAVVLYILCRLDVLPESPRFLYLVGKREEGYYNLLDMYDKEIWAFRRLKSAETHRNASKIHQKAIKRPWHRSSDVSPGHRKPCPSPAPLKIGRSRQA